MAAMIGRQLAGPNQPEPVPCLAGFLERNRVFCHKICFTVCNLNLLKVRANRGSGIE
jgi:hypothetical protein